MKKNTWWIVVLLLLFLAGALLLGLFRPNQDLPFSSYNNGPDGVRALYVLLEEEGFQVARKLRSIEETGDGVLLVFDPDSLHPENPEALAAWQARGNVYMALETPWNFRNGSVSAASVHKLVTSLWPWRDRTVWFDEYGREGIVDSDLQPGGGETPFSILPDWLRAGLAQLLFAALLCLLFLNTRLGAPDIPAERRPREETEETFALASLMARAGLWPDALRLCYRRLVARTGLRYPHIEQQLETIGTQQNGRAAAPALASEMERLRKEKTP
ncbi:MAG: DUF4350 domain-containing protein [Oscillospiraceae bacterium]|jgi:hypothetical protein|nr:DUF4350 domain-containing protein [Oscillospiraceae bacterium]